MKVQTWGGRVPIPNIESSTWNFQNGIISSLIIQLWIIRVLHILISSIGVIVLMVLMLLSWTLNLRR